MSNLEFDNCASVAKILSDNSPLPDADYWDGYLRGLRRAYQSAPQEPVELLLSCFPISGPTDRVGKQRQQIYLKGYETGFDGTLIPEAIKRLHAIIAPTLAAAAAGSVRSAAKTAAVRENAKRPRPGAKGKLKPRKKPSISTESAHLSSDQQEPAQ
jgi:hypothetical protein